jgi:predicted dehydrogenase/nucleoside-diphosphate-sugar epimerase
VLRRRHGLPTPSSNAFMHQGGSGLAMGQPHGERTVRVGFIGAGNMAGHHLQALRSVATPHRVVGVSDVRSATATAFAQRAGAPAFATIADLLEQAQPEIVHICTPAGRHFEPARQALQAGAHIYVEKPFVETPEEAETLFGLARERGLLICSGHQLVRDRAFRLLMQRAPELGPVTLVDSCFAFRPPQLDPYQAAGSALARQLLDILPHPLYVLVAALERFGHGPGGHEPGAIEIMHVTATPTSLYAQLRAGDVTGRLAVSLRVRPVASTLTIAGANGSLTTDFVRSILLGAANEGTSPIEKIVNPFMEAAQLAWRSATSLVGRVTQGADYPGLVELLRDFYAAAASGGGSPVSVDHLRRVTRVYEQLAVNLRSVARPGVITTTARTTGPLAVLTGAGGFFGRAIGRELTRRGFRVRGIGRSERPDTPYVHEWARADLANEIGSDVLAGATVVVHAAAETSGGFDAHERNTIGATRELLRAMAAAGVRRLVHISSISVLRPPRPFWERQAESTPLAERSERLGPYTWGKCGAEHLVAMAVARGEIEARIVRPAALIDWSHIELPGLIGRRLFNRWHLGLGRPGLPFAACDVSTAAAAVAWCADRFREAPSVINLMDPAIRTRGQLLERFREHGWRGRMLWTPISLLAGSVMAARVLLALARRERGGVQALAVWSILRPRRYDSAVSSTVLTAACEHKATAKPPVQVIETAGVSRVYG